MAEYRIVIRVDGEGNATSFLGGVGGALGNIAQIAAGGAIALGIGRIGDAIGGTIGAALDATKSYENLGISLDALLAREIKNASGVEKTSVVGQQKIQLTQNEIAEINKLKQTLADEGLARTTLGARIQEQKERIRQLTAQYGENGLVVIKERAELAQMENQMSKMDGTIAAHTARVAELESKQGALANVTQKVIEGQLSMNEALAQAGPKTKEYLDWIQQLAIKSPFKQSDIANAFKTVMAYGFTSDAAQELTKTLVDFSAVSDPTGQKMGLIAYALGQIRTSDKLLTQDLRQLMNAGIDVNAILGKMGFKLSDVGTKAIDSKKFLEVFIQTMQEDFGGAAERSAGTLTGLLSSLDDVKEVGLRNLFEGAFGALKPLLQDAVDTLASPQFFDRLRGIGTSIGEGIQTGVTWIRQGVFWVTKFWSVFQSGLALGLNPLLALQNALRVLLPPELQPQVQMIFGLLNQGLAFLQTTGVPALAALGVWLTGTGVPALQAFGMWLQTSVVPALLQFAAIAGPQLGAGLNQMAVWLQQIFVWGQQLALQALPLLAQGFQWAGDNMQIVAPVLGVIAAALGLILAPVIAIPALLILLATAWANNWGGIQEKTAAVWAVVQPVLAGIAGFLGTLVTKGGEFATWLQINVPTAVSAAQSAFARLDPVWELLKRGVSASISILTLLGNSWNRVNTLVNQLISGLGYVIAKFLGIQTSASATQGRLEGFGVFLQNVGQIILQFYENQLSQLLQGFQFLVGLLESIAYWLGVVSDALSNVSLPDWAQRHSPSPIEQTFMGWAAALRDVNALLPQTARYMNVGGRFASVTAGAGNYAPVAPTPSASARGVHIGTLNIQAHDYADFLREFERQTGVEFALGT